MSFASVTFISFLLFSINSYANKEYTEIEWTQLIPADDLAALLNPPASINDIEDGTDKDNINGLADFFEDSEGAKRFNEALG